MVLEHREGWEGAGSASDILALDVSGSFSVLETSWTLVQVLQDSYNADPVAFF